MTNSQMLSQLSYPGAPNMVFLSFTRCRLKTHETPVTWENAGAEKRANHPPFLPRDLAKN